MRDDRTHSDQLPDSAGERTTLSSSSYAAPPFADARSDRPFTAGAAVPPVLETLAHAYVDDAWSIPWSDLMMVMFVLFATLLIMDLEKPDTTVITEPEPIIEEIEKELLVDRETPVPSADPTSQLSINVFDESQQAVRTAELADVEIALLSDQSVKVSVQGPMLFELGKADLRPEVQSFLDSLAFVIRQTPFEVRVIGHTDDQPINTNVFPSNWELSLVRASRVARYLIRAGELDPTRFVVMGRGQYAPVAANEDDASRALNRRVEIIITRTRNPDTSLAGDVEPAQEGDSS